MPRGMEAVIQQLAHIDAEIDSLADLLATLDPISARYQGTFQQWIYSFQQRAMLVSNVAPGVVDDWYQHVERNGPSFTIPPREAG